MRRSNAAHALIGSIIVIAIAVALAVYLHPLFILVALLALLFWF